MTPAARPRKQDRPQVAPGDVIFLAAVFLAICAVFATVEGLSLELPGGSGVLVVAASPDGHLAVDGRPASMESVESAVQSALALNPKVLVVVRRDSNANHALMIDLLNRLRQAGAARIAIKGFE
jgi:biopolymer transport protein ExbD